MQTAYSPNSAFALAFILLTFLLLEKPSMSHATDVYETLFFMTTEEDFPDGSCVVCVGPWDRCGQVTLSEGKDFREHFYTATGGGIFHHWGTWACNASINSLKSCGSGANSMCTNLDTSSESLTDPGVLDAQVLSSFPDTQLVIPEVRFTVKSCDARVGLRGTPSSSSSGWKVRVFDCVTGALRDASDGDPRSVEIGGFLGNRSSLGGNDIDEYMFGGTAGEKIVVRLDRDRQGGSAGETATLTFRDQIAGVQIRETRTGVLPLEIPFTLPKTGSYAIRVSQVRGRSQTAFRGNFILGVTTSADIIRPLQARPNVEP